MLVELKIAFNDQLVGGTLQTEISIDFKKRNE